MGKDEFLSRFENIVEHTPKVAEELLKLRPFENEAVFINSLETVIDNLSHADKVKILECHPDLAGKLADENLLTPESTREQREAGLHLLSVEEKKRLKHHNDEYRNKFGFTFIICARENKAAAILEGLSKRLVRTRDEEIVNGMKEVQKIAKLRAEDIIKNCTVPSKL